MLQVEQQVQVRVEQAEQVLANSISGSSVTYAGRWRWWRSWLRWSRWFRWWWSWCWSGQSYSFREQLIQVVEVVEVVLLQHLVIRWFRYCYCKSTRTASTFNFCSTRYKHSCNITAPAGGCKVATFTVSGDLTIS
jgi:hypothetical protein